LGHNILHQQAVTTNDDMGMTINMSGGHKIHQLVRFFTNVAVAGVLVVLPFHNYNLDCQHIIGNDFFN